MVKVKEVMKKSVFTIDPEVNLADVAKIMTNNRIGSLIITEGGKPTGIITDSDIVTIVARGMNPKKVKVKDVPKKRFITAEPEDDLIKVTRNMIKNGKKRVPVIKDGQLQGILSDKEILLVSPELLEIMSEKLKARVAMVSKPQQTISGICEQCEGYSDNIRNIDGKWVCEDCR